jgi:integrase
MTSIDPSTDEVYYDTTSSRLRDAALAPATLTAYNTNVNKFLSFTRLPSLAHLLRLDPTLIDQRLAEYIDSLFAERSSYHYASHTLFGLIFRCPPLRLHLGESRLRLRGWNRLKEQRSHPPITWELTVLLAVTMSKWGYHAESVATLLAFDCLLRVGELTRITFHDVIVPGDSRLGSAFTGMVIRLARAKTGLNQSVSLENPQVQAVLQAYLLQYPFLEKDRIFPFSPPSYRRLIQRVASSHGLGHVHYVPHSFRHGGATFAFQRGTRIEDIMYRGRWVSLESARRYIQTARALLILLDIPNRLHQQGTLFAPHLDGIMQHLWTSVPSAARKDRRVWFRRSV